MQLKNKEKQNLEAINKQEKQLKKSRIKKEKKELIKRFEREEKSGRTVLLRDKLNNILISYDMNITDKGEDILEKLANNERIINYNNLFFKNR